MATTGDRGARAFKENRGKGETTYSDVDGTSLSTRPAHMKRSPKKRRKSSKASMSLTCHASPKCLPRRRTVAPHFATQHKHAACNKAQRVADARPQSPHHNAHCCGHMTPPSREALLRQRQRHCATAGPQGSLESPAGPLPNGPAPHLRSPLRPIDTTASTALYLAQAGSREPSQQRSAAGGRATRRARGAATLARHRKEAGWRTPRRFQGRARTSARPYRWRSTHGTAERTER